MLGSRMGLCLPRHIPFNSTSIRYKSSKIKHHTVDPPGHGEKIYVFTHLQTKQVVYSLSRVLNNSAALAQIPYNGKKTVPRALRKDLWMPLAKICFSPGAGRTGLSAFQKLREYKRLHELQWGDEIALTEDGIPEKRNVRGRKIQNQKANSIADIAAVLSKIGTTEGAQIGLKGGFRNIEDQKAWIEEQAENTAQHMKTHHDATEEQMVELKAKRRRELEKKFEAENGEEVLTMVEVQWKDLNDAEFAEKWSENVVHDTLLADKKSRVEAVPWSEKAATEDSDLVTEEEAAAESSKAGETAVAKVARLAKEKLDKVAKAAQSAASLLKIKEDKEALERNRISIEEAVLKHAQELESQGLTETEVVAAVTTRRQELEASTLTAKEIEANIDASSKAENARLEQERQAAHIDRQAASRTKYLISQGVSEVDIRADVNAYRERMEREIVERETQKAGPFTPAGLSPKRSMMKREKILEKKAGLQRLIDNNVVKQQTKKRLQEKYVEKQLETRAQWLKGQGKSDVEVAAGLETLKGKMESEVEAVRKAQEEKSASARTLWQRELQEVERLLL